MEEKEVKQAEMPKKPEKLTYEQLEAVAHQLSDQSRKLYLQLQEANKANLFERLNYLFKVVKYSNSFNVTFVEKCVAEIEQLMTIQEEDTEKEK